MRFALTISTLLHVSIVLIAVYGLPRMTDRFEVEEEPMVVELVTIGDETTPQPAEREEPLPPPDAEEPPPPPKVSMTPPPAPPKLELAPPLPPEPKMAEAPPLPPPPMPKVEKRPPSPTPPPKLAMAPPPSSWKPPPPPPAPPSTPKPVAATPPAPLPKVPKPLKKVIAKLAKAPRPRAKPTPPKKDFKSTLDRIAALLDKSEKAPSPPSKRAEKASETRPRSRTVARAAAGAAEAQELTIREIDALRLTIRKQIELCWSVPGGARDAENLSVRVRFFLNSDGSLAGSPEVVDQARMFAAGGDFYRTAAESARRAVLHCSPLANLPIDKYEYWREVTLTFNPKDMLR